MFADQHSQLIKVALMLFITIAAIFILITAKTLLIPIALGILFAFFLYPTAQKMEEWGIPRLLVNFILILSFLIITFGVLFILSYLMTNFVEDIPQIKENFLFQFETIKQFLEVNVGVDIGEAGIIAQSENALFSFDSSSIKQFFSTTSNTIFIFGLMIVYIFLFLYYRDKFREFLFRLTHSKKHKLFDRVLKEVSEVTPRYLTGLLIVVSILAVINSLGFWIVGLNHPIFFGVLAAILNLIPYLGTIIGYVVVFLFALATQSMGVALGIVILFFIIQFTENNILTPNITGGRVHINPLMTIIALVAAGAVWGFVGMFIVLPFLAMFKICASHIDSLKPYAYLLGTEGTERYAISQENIRKRFSRLFR